MTVKAVNQATIVDVTDAYSVILDNEAHTFVGSTSTLGTAQTTTAKITAMLGGDVVAASVTLSEVTAPSGVTVSKDTDATSPTLTFSLAATVAAGGTITIPVHVGTDITINKTFSFSIAFRGATGTTGADGKGISSTSVTYQASSSGTTAPTGTWTATVPAVSPSQYLWTRTVITYSDSTTSTAYSVGMMGATGAAGTNGTNGTNGADALTLVVTSSNGLIFKNSAIATVLTAHVYKGGVEVTGTDIAALGTIKWYKDGSTTAAATGQTLTIDAGDVTGKATYVAQLEG
jgi:hypothetical protein